MSLNERVSENVKVIAVSRGTTPTAVARSLGRSHQWIQAKIAGRNKWTLDDLELVAAELEVAPSALVGAPLALQVVESALAAVDKVVGPALEAIDYAYGDALQTVRHQGLEPRTRWLVLWSAIARRAWRDTPREGWVLAA
jgi:hypothetical protein